jgi:amidase
MTGVDPDDAATAKSAGHIAKDYTAFLKTGSLKGARIGVARDFTGKDAETDRVFNTAVATLEKLGATVIDVRYPAYFLEGRLGLSSLIMASEFKTQIGDYLKTTGPAYPKTFDELVARANDPATGYRQPTKAFALKYTGSVGLDLKDPVYLAAVNQGLALTTETVLALFRRHQLDAIVYPTSTRPAALIKPVRDPMPADGTDSATSIANQTGFPDLIVPAGMTSNGLPVTISFFGPAWSEPKLLGYGYDFEQATQAIALPRHTPALPSDKLHVD